MTHTFEIVDAKPYHCGQMARLLRAEHASAMIRVGADPHKELRACFDQSFFRKAWMIDGRLAAIGGVTGTIIAPYGLIWLAMSETTKRYPKEIIREARRQLEAIMQVKSELATTIVAGDEGAKRLAVFLGFHVGHDGPGDRAVSRHGRRMLMRHLDDNPDLRILVGAGYVIPMGYHHDEAA